LRGLQTAGVLCSVSLSSAWNVGKALIYPCDNSAIFSRAVAFVEGEQHAALSPRLAVLADFAVNGRL
jgi:hypothetical protein